MTSGLITKCWQISQSRKGRCRPAGQAPDHRTACTGSPEDQRLQRRRSEKAADKAKREFMASLKMTARHRPPRWKKWRKARKAAEVAKPTTTTAAPVPEVKPQLKPAAPAPSADTAPAYCEQISSNGIP